MLFRRLVLILIISLLHVYSYSQIKKYPTNYFRSPLDITHIYSGTFGELRSNHFHSGVDFKTKGKTGLKIYAIADGYVSRIKVSAWGYGYALYVKHPNGYTSVYGHLEKYNDEIAEYVKKYQYRIKSFGFDHFPDSTEFRVKKGDILGYSGNTGYSGGPHLHFEIRDSKTEYPMNPLLFGMNFKDDIAPTIELIKVYPLENSLINDKDSALLIDLADWDKKSPYKDTIDISGTFGLGICTFDMLNYAYNHNGVYEIQLYIDDKLIYAHDLEKFGFHETRYLNSLIDYEYYKKEKKRIQKSFIEQGNKLGIYSKALNKGFIELTDTLIHSLSYLIKDVAGNQSLYKIFVKGVSETIKERKPCNNPFRYDKENYYSDNGCMVYMPKGVLYSDICFEFMASQKIEGSFSKLYTVHDKYVPAHKSFSISIKPDTSMNIYTKSKAFIARVEGDANNLFVYEGGKWSGSYLMTNSRNFGDFAILIDTVAPEVTPINFSNNQNVSNLQELKVKITDDLSGIDDYKPSLNGEWILMEYDGKNDLLIYKFDHRVIKGKNTFQLVVTDNKENKTIYRATITK